VKTCFFILLILLGKPTDDTKDYISCKLFEVPFQEFTKEIYRQTGVKIFYEESSVSQLKVSLDADSISVEMALKTVLKGTNIQVSAWQNNYILLANEKLITNLPDFEKRIADEELLNKNISNNEIDYIQAKKAITTTILVGKNGASSKSTYAKVHGQVVEKELGIPLQDATIYILETGKGAVTNKDGFFSLSLTPGKYNARIESLGHEKKRIFMEVLSDGEINIELTKESLLINDLFVYSDQQTNIRSKDIGLVKISPRTIKNIPMMIGERDILKVSSLLPGIVSVGEGSSGLNVRGGSSDQNAFYINKVPIYNTSHLFGFFPAFNSDIIKDFSVYKGYVPAEYGGRLSSVFDIVTRQGNRKRYTAHGGLNPITGYITFEGPLMKDSLTLLVSARASYSDWILSKIKDPTIHNSSAKFNDFSSSLNYNLKKSQLSLFLYNSNDKFSLSDITQYQYSNLGGSLNLHYNFNTSLKGDFTLIGSEYSFKTIDNQIITTAYKNRFKLGHYEVRGDFKHIINDKNSLDYGANIISYSLDKGEILPYGLESLKAPLNLGKEKGIESAIYLTHKYNVLEWLTVTLGFRQSLYTPIGPKQVNIYTNGYPREEKYVKDTIFFKSNKPIKWYFSPELRTTVNIQTDRNGSVKLSFNKMQQNLFMLNNTIAVSPNTQWKLADYYIKPSKSIQFSLGIFRNFPKEGMEASIELYTKKISNYPEFKDGANFTGSSAVETSILQGTQKAYGIEFFVKRTAHKLDGWLSYTYSRSIVRVNGQNSWDKINKGEAYPSNFDIPHSLNALINYHFSRRLTLSTITTYQTGRPVTYLQSIFYYNGNPYIEYSKRNKYNIPDYFRVDLSLTIEGNLKKYKLIHSSLMFSVYNLTGRKNPYSVYYTSTDSKISCYKYSVIGIPLFTVTWLFKFGNYDSD